MVCNCPAIMNVTKTPCGVDDIDLLPVDVQSD